MNKNKFYQAQFLEICEHEGKVNEVLILLVPFDQKGWFITGYFTYSLIPEGWKVNDYGIVELQEEIDFDEYHLVTKAIITINSNPDMSYFEKIDFFKDMDISWLKDENYDL